MRQLQRILMSLRIFYISIRHDKLGSKAERKIEKRDVKRKGLFDRGRPVRFFGIIRISVIH